MIYAAMKRIITNENNKFNNGIETVDTYNVWKQNTQNKLDVFFCFNRLTLSQYEELTKMLLNLEQDAEQITDDTGDVENK